MEPGAEGAAASGAGGSAVTGIRARFWATKHSWRGKYKRVISVTDTGYIQRRSTHTHPRVATLNPANGEPTNEWPFKQGLLGARAAPDDPAGILLSVRRGDKGIHLKERETLKFTVDDRARFLTILHRHHILALADDSTASDAMHKAGLWSSSHPPPQLRSSAKDPALDRIAGGVGSVVSKDPNGKSIWPARKFTRSETWRNAILGFGVDGLLQIDPSTNVVLSVYPWQDIGAVCACTDLSGGLIVYRGAGNRAHLFDCGADQRKTIVQNMTETALECCGVVIPVGAGKGGTDKVDMTLHEFSERRLGSHSDEIDSFHSQAEFNCVKHTSRHPEPISRILVLTENHLVERDAKTYGLVSARPLADLDLLVRSPKDAQQLSIEWADGTFQRFSTTDRDAFIVSAMDSARACDNNHVQLGVLPRISSLRLLRLRAPADTEVSSMYLNALSQFRPPEDAPPAKVTLMLAKLCTAFNSNISAAGIDGTSRQKRLVRDCIINIVMLQKDVGPESWSAEALVTTLAALRRLLASTGGMESFNSNPTTRQLVIDMLWRPLQLDVLDDGALFAALDTALVLIQPRGDDPNVEKANKEELLASGENLERLVNLLMSRVEDGSAGNGLLAVSALVDFLTFVLCQPFSDTTEDRQFQFVLGLVTNVGRPLFKLFGQHQCLPVMKGAGLIMKAIIEEAGDAAADTMQEMALQEGALLQHLHSAFFTKPISQRHLDLRDLSRYLVGMWAGGYDPSLSMLGRVLPPALVRVLEQPTAEEIAAKEREKEAKRAAVQKKRDLEAARLREVAAKKAEAAGASDADAAKPRRAVPVLKAPETPTEPTEEKPQPEAPQPEAEQPPPAPAGQSLAKRWQRLISRKRKPFIARERRPAPSAKGNWPALFDAVGQTFEKPDLIWTTHTHEELREALEAEISAFSTQLAAGKRALCWNHLEFKVDYPSLARELNVGGFYLRILLNTKDNKVGPLHNPKDFLDRLYHTLVLHEDPQLKGMCLQAMTMVYRWFHKSLGQFHDLPVMVNMLKSTTNPTLRDRLLLFLDRLLVNTDNCSSFIDHDGVWLLVDLLTLVHMHRGRATVPLQTNLLTGGDEYMAELTEAEKEWFHRTPDMPPGERLGPFTERDIVDMVNKGTVNNKSRLWAQGLRGWTPLNEVTQLRWTVLAGKEEGVFDFTKMGLLILQMLHRLVTIQPTRTDEGAVLFPIPRAKRALSDPNTLPHLVQVMCTFDPELVERTAALLHLVVEDNPQAMAKLYQTGAYYFSLMYPGSNFLTIAEFLRTSHAGQRFREDSVKLEDLSARSILSPMLPEAMIYLLGTYSAEKFSEVFLGDFDTPEAIWNNDMRRLMINKVASHVGDFQIRLTSNTHATYQYFPIPPVVFPQLESELFCKIYYLRNLCDTERFSEWPIRHQVDLMAAVLVAYRKTLEETAPVMSEHEALSTLGLPAEKQAGEREVRKAYYRLASKYHPDKNPEGRDIFEQIQMAYEILSAAQQKRDAGGKAGVGDTRATHHLLCLRAQVILFQRFPTILKPYKYAGYPMLLDTIGQETKSDDVFKPEGERPSAVEVAAQLGSLTIATSPLNAEELRRDGGIPILAALFSRCVSVLSGDADPTCKESIVTTHLLRTFTGLATFPSCREAILELPTLITDALRCLYLRSSYKAVQSALEFTIQLAQDPPLQRELLNGGLVWHCMNFLFQYDYTLEDGGVEKDTDTNTQEVANATARLAAKALSRLGGWLSGDNASPKFDDARACQNALLSVTLAKRLADASPHEFLRSFNGNHRTPILLWDQTTRQELRDLLEARLTMGRSTGDFKAMEATQFLYSTHTAELQVDGVFLRILDEQPTFKLAAPAQTLQEILVFMESGGVPTPVGPDGTTVRRKPSPFSGEGAAYRGADKLGRVHLAMCLRAVRHLIVHHSGPHVEEVLLKPESNWFALLFGILDICPRTDSEMQTEIMAVLDAIASSGATLVAGVAEAKVLGRLVRAVRVMPAIREATLNVIFKLATNGKAVAQMFQRGVVVYLMQVFQAAKGQAPEVRHAAVQALVRLSQDKHTGRRVILLMEAMAPPYFLTLMRDDALKTCEAFDSESETPELVWGATARAELAEALKGLSDPLFARQKEDPECEFRPEPDWKVEYSQTAGELLVGGVFVRLFLEHPKTILHDARRFTDELFKAFDKGSRNNVDEEELVLVSTAICVLFKEVPTLAGHAANLGHVERVFALFALPASQSQPKRAMCIVNVVQEMAHNSTCLTKMASANAIQPMMSMLETQPKYAALVTGCLSKILGQAPCGVTACLSDQALRAGLVQYGLKLLAGGADSMPESQTVKAHVVACLRSVSADDRHGSTAAGWLAESEVWNQFKDQKHDLFIASGGPVAGLLTGPAVEVAGYLPAPSKSHDVAPPEDDTLDGVPKPGEIDLRAEPQTAKALPPAPKKKKKPEPEPKEEAEEEEEEKEPKETFEGLD